MPFLKPDFKKTEAAGVHLHLCSMYTRTTYSRAFYVVNPSSEASLTIGVSV